MFRSIVVGTDGSDTAGKAVDEAIDLAKAVGAALCIVSAYEPVPKARLREEARQTPADLQWMVNPREDVDATLATPPTGARGGRRRSRPSPARATRPTRSSTSPRSATPT